MANGNGKTNGGSGTIRHADLVLADAIQDLCQDIKVEVIKMEGLAQAIIHRRVVTNKIFRGEFLESVQRIGERHLALVARVREKLA